MPTDFTRLRGIVNDHLAEFDKQDLDTRVHYLEEAILSPRFGAVHIGAPTPWKLISPDGHSYDPVLAADNDGYVTLYEGAGGDTKLLFDANDVYMGFADEIDDKYLNLYRFGGNTYLDIYEIDLEVYADYVDLIADVYASTLEVDSRFMLNASGRVWGWWQTANTCAGTYLAAGSWAQVAAQGPAVFDAIGDVRIFDETNLGPEIHTEANAANIDNEADATTGWTGGSGTLTSSMDYSPFGDYGLKLVSNAGWQGMSYAFTAVVGRIYRVKLSVKSTDNDIYYQRVRCTGLGISYTIPHKGTETYIFYGTATSTSPTLQINTSYADPETIWVDGVSIKEVLPGGGDLSIGGTLTLNTSGVPITEFSTDGTLGGMSDAAVSTELAVATAIAAAVAEHNAHQHGHAVAREGALLLAGTVAMDFAGQHETDVDGALTLVGAVTKVSAAALAGALALAGAVTKSTTHATAGALSLAGGTTKQADRCLAGALALTGNLTTN